MSKNQISTGILYLVATPIGNLSDISQRALETLRQVDRIAAEDTRRTGAMLNQYAINKPLLALHDHNEDRLSRSLIEQLLQGAQIALVSDAGTPLINDPGYPLVAAARAADITVTPIPGACALITALCASGLSTARFCFEGFPPRHSSQRKKLFKTLEQSTHTLIFYESSHRILECLQDLRTVFAPERRVVLARELTKRFETFIDTNVGEAPDILASDPDQQKGEFVLMLEGAAEIAPTTSDTLSQEHQALLSILLEECSVRTASKLAAKLSGLSKDLFYRYAISLRNEA